MSGSAEFCIGPGGNLRGEIRIPGDKSISHRAIMMAAIAEGMTAVTGFLEAEDSLATVNAFRSMGVTIDGPDNSGNLNIHGVGLDGLKPPGTILDLGNSGTSMRLLSGLMVGQDFDTTLTGDQSLCSRPMQRVTEPLTRMKGDIRSAPGGLPPLHIKGNPGLLPINYDMPLASAQVKSCLLLAGLYAHGTTCVVEPAPTRDHTERMLASFSYPVKTNRNRVCLTGRGRLIATQLDVPGDISSAAFFMVGASIARQSDVMLRHVGINPTRTGVIEILGLMGAHIDVHNRRLVGQEPVADIRVSSAQLKGARIPEELVPIAIDEFPALFIAGACAEGQTVLTGARELRVKESDRIKVMADGLYELGIQTKIADDGIVINGGCLSGGEIDSHGDHRNAMAFSIAALRAVNPITVLNCDNVNTSFPGFAHQAKNLGLEIVCR